MADNGDDGNVVAGDDATSSSSSSQQTCEIYNQDDWFTIFVQVLLAFLALCSLYLKRLQEVPRRTFVTWFLDVSKQGFGAVYAHVLNMIISAVISKNLLGDTQTTLRDQCAWYGMSYMIDTTLGLVLAIAGLQLLDYLANRYNWTAFKNSGVYHGSDGLRHWLLQVLAWLFILTVGKIIIFIIMLLGYRGLGYVGGILFAPLQGNIRFELLFVMILFPGLLNVIYFWIADGYLKAKKDQHKAHEADGEGEKDRKEALLDPESNIGGGDVQLPPSSSSERGTYHPQPWSTGLEPSAAAAVASTADASATTAAAAATDPPAEYHAVASTSLTNDGVVT